MSSKFTIIIFNPESSQIQVTTSSDSEMAGLREHDQIVREHFLRNSLSGSGYVESHIFQKGSGIGNVLSAVGKALLPTLKKVGRYVGNAGLNFLKNTGSDLLQGQTFGDSVKNNAAAALENAKFDAVQKITKPQRAKKRKAKPRKNRARKKPISSRLW